MVIEFREEGRSREREGEAERERERERDINSLPPRCMPTGD